MKKVLIYIVAVPSDFLRRMFHTSAKIASPRRVSEAFFQALKPALLIG
jgi:hypothetical protein